MSEDKNPTPASLRETAKQVLAWLNDEFVACPDGLRGIGWPISEGLTSLLTDLCNAVLAEPPAVRCAHRYSDGSACTLPVEHPVHIWDGGSVRNHAFQPAVRCAGNEEAVRLAGAQAMLEVCKEAGTDHIEKFGWPSVQAALSAPVPQPPAGNEGADHD